MIRIHGAYQLGTSLEIDEAGAILIEGDDLELRADGAWLVPGLIDLRAHLREPGDEPAEDLESGLQAAAAGGFASVCAMPGTRPPNDDGALTEILCHRAAKVRGARFLPFGCMTQGMRGEELTQMEELKAAGCVGVTDDHRPVADPALLRRAMEYAETFDILVMQHAELPELSAGTVMHEGPNSVRLGLRGSPRAAEVAAVARDIQIAELTGGRLHLAHLSCGASVELVKNAKERGARVTCDVSPHHLAYTDADVGAYDSNFRIVPPLRSPEDRDALRRGVNDGTIDAIASDHAPHPDIAKRRPFASAAPGMISFETTLPVLLALIEDGSLRREAVVRALSVGPARVLGLPGERFAGDFTLIDPRCAWTVSRESLRSKSANTPMLGREVRGAAILTIVEGQVVFQR